MDREYGNLGGQYLCMGLWDSIVSQEPVVEPYIYMRFFEQHEQCLWQEVVTIRYRDSKLIYGIAMCGVEQGY